MARRLGPKKGHAVESMLFEQLTRWLGRNHTIHFEDVPTPVWNSAWRVATDKYYNGVKVEVILNNIGMMIANEFTR